MSRCIGLYVFFYFLSASLTVNANGVFRNGLGARSISLGGAGVAFCNDPLNSINFNPAALGQFDSTQLQGALTVGIIDAEYSNSVSNDNDADSTPGFIPEAAFVQPLTNSLSMGVSFSPIAALEVDWGFLDPPGAVGSYGQQTNKSSFLAIRSSAGLGFQISPDLSIGASLGLVYNRNRLKAPYIFQTASGLAGTKVLINLDTDGYGLNGVVGLNYKPVDKLNLNLGYTSPTTFETNGTLRGTSNPVIGLGSFSFDAEVESALPQIISGGMTWQTTDKHILGLQLDWIDWSDAFDELPLDLTNESTGFAIPIIYDVAPLEWDDQIVVRLGGEYNYSDKLKFRAGYSYGNSPVPSDTLTPTTAAIMQHTIGFGLGYRLGKYNIDLAYQWDLPVDDKTGNSRILFNEFDNSEVDVGVHWLSISVSIDDPFAN